MASSLVCVDTVRAIWTVILFLGDPVFSLSALTTLLVFLPWGVTHSITYVDGPVWSRILYGPFHCLLYAFGWPFWLASLSSHTWSPTL